MMLPFYGQLDLSIFKILVLYIILEICFSVRPISLVWMLIAFVSILTTVVPFIRGRIPKDE